MWLSTDSTLAEGAPEVTGAARDLWFVAGALSRVVAFGAAGMSAPAFGGSFSVDCGRDVCADAVVVADAVADTVADTVADAVADTRAEAVVPDAAGFSATSPHAGLL
mmetsp:Transcript_40094/g.64852  ORF Transcript_40094/g.64852 Transcript_40094/m.64852 type:complete len:107 (+) Transcript_40094:25-345(+)